MAIQVVRSNDMQTKESIIEQAIQKYGNLSQPRFDFVQKTFDRQPYSSVIDQLIAKGFEVEDTTDLNEDVSLCLHVKKDSGSKLVQLSLVGPYGVVFDIENDNQVTLSNNKVGVDLVDVLQECEIQLIDEAILTSQIEFDGEVRSIYTVLFSNTDELPWNPN